MDESYGQSFVMWLPGFLNSSIQLFNLDIRFQDVFKVSGDFTSLKFADSRFWLFAAAGGWKCHVEAEGGRGDVGR